MRRWAGGVPSAPTVGIFLAVSWPLRASPPDSGRPLPSAETARKREAGRMLRKRKSWKRKSLRKALPRQPQGPSSPPCFPASPDLGERPALPSQARLQEAHHRKHSQVASNFPGLLIKMRNLRPRQPRRADNTLPGEPSHLSLSGSPLSRKTCFLKKKKLKNKTFPGMCGGVGGDGGGEGEREGKKKRGILMFPDSREAGMPPAQPHPTPTRGTTELRIRGGGGRRVI